MKISAGIIIKHKDRLLFCLPSNYTQTYSFPKGGVERTDKNLKDTAIRECYEEVGIKINESQINDEFVVKYTKLKTKAVSKIVHLFLVEIQNLTEINLTDYNVPKQQLQTKEISWAGFLTKQQVTNTVFWRLKPILNTIFPD